MSRCRLRLNATSSAVSVEPSWNFTPSRIVSTIVRGSGMRWALARPGFIVPSGSNVKTVSKMFGTIA